MANITDILNKPATEVEAPKPIPAGTYHCVVKGLPELGESSKKHTPYYRYEITPIAPVDFDESQTAELEASGGLDGKVIRSDFYITEDALFMLTNFLESLGIDKDNKTVAEMVDESPNRECLVYIRHEPSSRPGDNRMFARFAGSAPVPA